jgi:cation diffusion facilitator family transporter
MKAVIAALAANLGIAIAKFAAFLVTGSASMLAEAVHSVADTGNELLLLIGSGRSRRARTELHPFGFGRERYFYAFVVAVLLFTVGAVFSIYDGVHKILSPEEVRAPAVAFVVLAVSAVLESFSLRTAIGEANRERGRLGWRSFVHATKAPELPVVLLEDLAALLGLGFAFLGVLLSVVTGDGVWDGAGSVAVGCLLACAAFVVGYETKSLLLGESASAEMSASIVRALEDGPEGFRVIHLRTSHVGPDSLLVAAKVAVPGSMSAADLVTRIDAAERRVRDAVPIAETIYLEPDIYSPAREDATDPSIQVVHQSRRPGRPRRPSGGSPPALPRSPLPRIDSPRLLAERAQRALLLEVQRPARRGGHVAGAPPQVGDRGADRWLGQHPQAERERGRGNVVPLLDPHRRGDGRQVLLGELPVRGPASRGPVSQRRQQPEVLPVAEHAGGHSETFRRFRDPHGFESNIVVLKKVPHACAAAA